MRWARAEDALWRQVDANIPTGTIFGVYEEAESMENCVVGKLARLLIPVIPRWFPIVAVGRVPMPLDCSEHTEMVSRGDRTRGNPDPSKRVACRAQSLVALRMRPLIASSCVRLACTALLDPGKDDVDRVACRSRKMAYLQTAARGLGKGRCACANDRIKSA